MQMPVVVGIIVAIILLVSFSGWFINMVAGWQEYILDDIFFWHRVAGASFFSIALMTLTFFGMAYAYECPNPSSDSKGSLSDRLNCPTFLKIKTGAEDLFKKKDEAPRVEPDSEFELEGQTEEI